MVLSPIGMFRASPELRVHGVFHLEYSNLLNNPNSNAFAVTIRLPQPIARPLAYTFTNTTIASSIPLTSTLDITPVGIAFTYTNSVPFAAQRQIWWAQWHKEKRKQKPVQKPKSSPRGKTREEPQL
ncbi:hypothetical protein H2201_006202 [Coniosporium apollinis]|uniref:Uncharacterized protein n=1 Tax=Coniosporium apollinis TaxID=61459 RepID=A0ABQ9NPI2_9PEZI|nr:hypothetical protein H2201_006202 [Coniosporium apollinis]